MIEDIIESLEKTTSYFLFKNSAKNLIGVGGKKNVIRESTQGIYFDKIIEKTKEKKIYNRAKVLLEIVPMKKIVEEEEYKKIKKGKLFFKRTEEVRIVKKEEYPVSLGEIWGNLEEKENAYAMVLAIDYKEPLGNSTLYFIVVGEERKVKEISKHFSGLSYKSYLEELFKRNPEAKDTLEKLSLENVKSFV